MSQRFLSYFQRNSTALNDLIIIAAVAILTYLVAYTIDLFEIVANWLEPYEPIQLAEWLIVLAILAIALAIFSSRRWRELKTELARRRELEAQLAQAISQTGRERGQIAHLHRQLQAERDTLETIMENTPAQLAYLDPQFNFVRVNAAYAQGSGHTRTDLIGRHHFDLFPNPENQVIFEQVRETGQPVEFYARPFEYADQPERGVTYWDWSLVPVKDENGRVQGVVFSLLDVTERRRMEDALREARANLEAKVEARTAQLSQANRELQYQAYLLANVSEAIVAVDTKGVVTAWNRAASDMYGRSAEEALGQPVTELFSPEYLDTDQAGVEQSLAETGRWRGEVHHSLPDGSAIICDVAVMILTDDGGQVTGSMRVARDVTRRKKMELALAEQERAYRTLAENLPGVVYRVFVREGHRMQFFNKMAKSVIGYRAEELAGGHICSIEALILPKDRAAVVAAVAQAMSENKPFTVEYRLKHKNGDLRYVIEQGRPMSGPDGLPFYIDGVIFDITERKQAEAMVRLQAQIIDQIHDAVVSTDLDGYVTSWNQGAVRLTGYSVDEALGRHISFIYPPDQQDFLQHQVIAPLKAGGSHEIEVRMQNRSGRAFYAHLSLSLLHNEIGVPFGMIGYSMDITARKQAEETMALYIERLEILRRLDRAILATQSLGEIASSALPYTRQLIPACQRASVVLYDFEANQAVWLASTGGNESKLSPGSRISLEFFGRIADFSGREYWLVNDIQTMARPTELDRILATEGVRSYVSIPFFFQNRMIGSLNVGSTVPGAFGEEDIQAAGQIADRLAIALQKSRLFEQVEAGQARLQALSRRLVDAQEAERRRLARELHDEIGQALTAIKLNLQGLQRLPEGMDLRTRLADSIDIAERVLQQVRNLSLDLRPSLLDDLGLVATLRWYLDRQAQWGGFSTQFVAEPAEMSICPDLETTCFRVVQEALTNIMRHAQAQQVRVELRQQGAELELTIQDDGAGFEVQAALDRAIRGGSLGLLSMQERVAYAGGQLDLESRPGHGAMLRVRCPLCGAGSPFAGVEDEGKQKSDSADETIEE